MKLTKSIRNYNVPERYMQGIHLYPDVIEDMKIFMK